MILDFDNGSFIHQDKESITFIKFQGIISELQPIETSEPEPEIAIIMQLDSNYAVKMLFGTISDREKAQKSIIKAIMDRDNKYIDLIEYEIQQIMIIETSDQLVEEENINES